MTSQIKEEDLINSKQRSHLRSLAHHLKPVVSIGKEGVTSGAFQSLDQALEKHELIKIKFPKGNNQKQNFKLKCSSKLSASVIGDIGNILIVFRANKDRDKRKYDI